MKCYCNSGELFEQCCSPLLRGAYVAPSAVRLMRSRFSAYKIQDYPYVLDTYCNEKRSELTVSELEESAAGSHWLYLDVLGFAESTVEFKAWYSDHKKLYLMHETSSFSLQDGEWRYDTGTVHDDSGIIKFGRNDPCFCNSGRKFKQCCQRKVR